MKKYLIIVVFTLGASLLLTYAAGSFLSAPNQINIGIAPEKLNSKNVSFTSKTGNPLFGWLIKGGDDRGGILLMHGVRSNRTQMTDRAIFLNKIGYTVLLFDFQAHGESPGKNITFGYLESKDAEAAFNFLQENLITKKIGVIGVSLGGASAIMSDVSSRANALVLEAVFPTLKDAVKNRMSIRLGVLGRLLSPLIFWQIEPRLGFNPNEIAPIKLLSKLRTPILMIAGTEDKHTTFIESKRMYDAVPGNKEFWAIMGAHHEDFLKYSPNEYKAKLQVFFEQNL